MSYRQSVIAKLPTSELEKLLDAPIGDVMLIMVEEELERRDYDESDPSYQRENT